MRRPVLFRAARPTKQNSGEMKPFFGLGEDVRKPVMVINWLTKRRAEKAF
jgi:hypothetical protein